MRACVLPKKSFYAAGWAPEKKAKLDSTQLPDTLGCNKCLKQVPSWKFSENQQREMRNAIACGTVRGYMLANNAYLRCTGCTPKQVVELECCICQRVKGLDGFTKAQRRDPDNARCIECVSDQAFEEPIEPALVQKYADEYDSDDESCISRYGDSTDYDGASVSGGVPLSQNEYTDQNLNFQNLRKVDASSGYTSTGVRSTSVDVEEDDDNGSDGSSHRTIQHVETPPRRPSKFAKSSEIGIAKPMQRAPKYKGRSLPKLEDSDEDSDDYTDDYFSI